MSDGGITDNYPIERLRAKGMDKIIGVNVQDSLVKREQLQSGIEVITQINNFRTIKDMQVKRQKQIFIFGRIFVNMMFYLLIKEKLLSKPEK